MIESTFVTFGNAIASAQVTVTKAAVSMKFLNVDFIHMYLRFLVIVGLSENECKELVSERVIVAGKRCKNHQTEPACSN
jgi:hypothetical protein